MEGRDETDDLIFIATEKCLMPRLMKIIGACEKTHRSRLWRFCSKFHQNVRGKKEEGARVEPLLFLGAQFSVAVY